MGVCQETLSTGTAERSARVPVVSDLTNVGLSWGYPEVHRSTSGPATSAAPEAQALNPLYANPRRILSRP